MNHQITLALLFLAKSYLTPETASMHVQHARDASRETGISVHLLLAQGWVESRYNTLDLSYSYCVKKVCVRKTHVWPQRTPPPNAQPSWYCGVLQVGGWVPWSRCLELRDDIAANYLEGARHLRMWYNAAPCRAQLEPERTNCALQGYSGGWASIENGATQYVRAVRAMEWRIKYVMRRQKTS